jgi:hypothetical protein
MVNWLFLVSPNVSITILSVVLELEVLDTTKGLMEADICELVRE